MDYEDIANASNITLEGDVTPTSSVHYIVQEIIFTLICAVAIIADVALIYTNLRFKRMRQIPNIILANWAMADLLCLLVAPSGYRILSIIDNFSLPMEFFCILFRLAIALHCIIIFFSILLTLDWCIAAYFEKVSEGFRRYCRFYMAAIWIFGLLTGSVSTVNCIQRKHGNVFEAYLIFFGYCFLLIFIILIHLVRLVKKCRRSYLSYSTFMLNVVSALVVNWLLGFLSVFAVNVGRPSTLHVYVELISLCLIFASSILIFIVMYRFNTDFQACFLLVLKRKSNKYEEADFDFHNPIRKPIVRNPIQITFNKTHELLTDVY